MKKFISFALIAAMAVTTLVGCGNKGGNAAGGSSDAAITVMSREDGSGTRGAFIELFGIEEEENGEKVDKTTDEASISEEVSSIVNKLAPMMQSETVEYDVKALINFLVENEGVAIDDVVYKLENHIGAKQIMADMGIVIDFTEEWTAEDALNQFLSEATMEQKEELLVMLYPEYEVVEGAETTSALEKVLANIMPTTASAVTAEVPISLAYEINMVNEDTFSAFNFPSKY